MSSIKDYHEKKERFLRRKRHVRRRAIGTAEKPRLAIYRSHKHIYCQLIDDLEGRTIAAASTRSKDIAPQIEGFRGNRSAASIVGKAIAEKARSAGVSRAQFDRAGYKYHGRVRALAEAAREGGLQI